MYPHAFLIQKVCRAIERWWCLRDSGRPSMQTKLEFRLHHITFLANAIPSAQVKMLQMCKTRCWFYQQLDFRLGCPTRSVPGFCFSRIGNRILKFRKFWIFEYRSILSTKSSDWTRAKYMDFYIICLDLEFQPNTSSEISHKKYMIKS